MSEEVTTLPCGCEIICTGRWSRKNFSVISECAKGQELSGEELTARLNLDEAEDAYYNHIREQVDEALGEE